MESLPHAKYLRKVFTDYQIRVRDHGPHFTGRGLKIRTMK